MKEVGFLNVTKVAETGFKSSDVTMGMLFFATK